MCFRAVKYLPSGQSYWLYLIHPLSCLPPNYIDYSSMSWLRSKMAAALTHIRCYSLIAILDFSLCGALGLLCMWQMLSYVHELSYKPMICSSPSSPLNSWNLSIVSSIQMWDQFAAGTQVWEFRCFVTSVYFRFPWLQYVVLGAFH